MSRYKKIEGGEKLRKFIQPMLAQLTDEPAFDDPDWLFEIKWDGYRAVAEVSQDEVKLYSRNGLSFSKAYKKVHDALGKLKRPMVLDGEIVVFNDQGQPDFQKLQNYANNSRHTIHYYLFDLLYLDGKDVMNLPLIERKKLLQSVIPKSDVLIYCDHVVGEGKAFFNQVAKNEMEGMIAKRSGSTYKPGRRNTDWLKIKNVKTEEAVIVGYTEPKGTRTGFGSLLLAQHIGGKLTYIGNVGTGFNEDTLQRLHRRLSGLRALSTPLDVDVKMPPGTTWINPEVVCNIKFTEKTSGGIIRHPVFLGVRKDKEPGEVAPEKALKKPRKSAAKRRT